MIVAVEVELPEGATIDATIGIVTYIDDDARHQMAISRNNCGTVTNAVGMAMRAVYAFERASEDS